MLKKIFYILFILFFIPACFAQNANTFFDLNNIFDAALTTGNSEKKSGPNFIEQQKMFEQTTAKLTQGNVVVAYDEYLDLLQKIDNDLVFLSLAQEFYKFGLFSLGDSAIENIRHKNKIQKQAEDLVKTYKPRKTFSVSEEQQLAKKFVATNYENYAQETSFELGKNKELLEKSDWANYLMAQAHVQLKQYQQARNYIDAAIAINHDNPNYALFKIKIMTLENKNKEALNYINKLEKSKKITNTLEMDFKIQKDYIEYNLTKDKTNKMLYTLDILYMQDDNYTAIKECENVLGIDKNNYKILTELARNYIKIGDIDKAENIIQKSYKLNNKYPKTLEIMGDISFIRFDYKLAQKYYKSTDSKINSMGLYTKLALTSFLIGDNKNLNKYSNKIKKNNNEPFYEFYDISTTIAPYTKTLSNGMDLSDEFLKKSILINPLYHSAWLNFAKRQINKDNLNIAENILTSVSMQAKPDFNFYYTNAILYNKLHKKNDAINNINKAIELNPNFMPAQQLKIIIESDY